jgi:hypothetical protein
MSQATKLAEQTVKAWRVLHACETVAEAAPVAELQSALGMKPQLLAREYWAPQTSTELSLLNMWHDVRDWRRALNEAEAVTSLQIVHAHSFASAMAGVRGSLPLVYDFVRTLEDVATHQAHGNSGPWLLRSFRVAEQFALSRASAVVVHSAAMKNVAHERGAAQESIFVVSEPLTAEDRRYDAGGAPDQVLDIGPTQFPAHRSASVVGSQYDEIYRYAYYRRTDNNTPKVEMPRIYALGMQKF